MKLIFVILLLLFSNQASATLSEKISVKVAFPLSKNLAKTKSNELQARLIAKNNIIKKYSYENIQLPKNIKQYHKKFIFGLILRSKTYTLDLKNFKKEKVFKKNNSIIYEFSANVINNQNGNLIDVWKILNKSVNEDLNLIRSLEMALSYKENINLTNALKSWKKKYKGGISYIVSDNLIDPSLFKFINKSFKHSKLPTELEEITALFDLAPLNLDICIKVYDALNKKNYKSVAYKILNACKTLHSYKTRENDLIILNQEIKKLKQLNIEFKKKYLINKILVFQGYLPIKLKSNNMTSKNSSLEELILKFEENPDLDYLTKLRDEIKGMDMTLINKYLTNQIGVSQNVQYKF